MVPCLLKLPELFWEALGSSLERQILKEYSKQKNFILPFDGCCGSSSTSLMTIGACVTVCNSALLLQKEVSQRQAVPKIPAPGSETSFKLQSGEGLKGLSIGPRTTDLGKHSRKTAVSVADFFQV